MPPEAATQTETHPVILGDELRAIAATIRHYCDLPDPCLATLIACWIANTYVYNRFDYCGYLALRSATPRCGKSKLLRLIGSYSKGRPTVLVCPSAAVLYRQTEDAVLLLDEVDNLRNRDKEAYGAVLSVLNAGFERGATVPRARLAGDDYEIVRFPVYGPKVIAGIESLADTLADRAFAIRMERSPHRTPRLKEAAHEVQAVEVRKRLERWAEQHGEAVARAYDGLPTEVPSLATFDDRFQDISEPLIVLATLADAESPSDDPIVPRILLGLKAAADRREGSQRERSLLAILEILATLMESEPQQFVPTGDLMNACTEKDELSWITSSKGLAGFLKHFDLKPVSTGKQRGYVITAGWLQKWQQRYAMKEAA